MSRRIPGREPSFSGSVQLRAWRSPVVSTPVLPPPDGSGPVDEPLDRQWTEYLAAPTREARDRLVVRYTPLVRVMAHRVMVLIQPASNSLTKVVTRTVMNANSMDSGK